METIKGMIATGSLVCQPIAAQSPVLAVVEHGAQRVLRMVTGKRTTRSQLDATSLTAQLRARAVDHIATALADELWLIADNSALRTPHAQAMPHLMRVKDLDGGFVNGYRTLNVIGITPSRRGVLYHRLFRSQAPGFVSESHEVQHAVTTVSQAITSLKGCMRVTWILDSGFTQRVPDVAVWRTIWEQEDHVVCRVKHTERLLSFQDRAGQWHAGDSAQARQHLKHLATAATMLVVQRGGQPPGALWAKEQRVPVALWACPVRLRDASNVRRGGGGEEVDKLLWLVEVRLPDTPSRGSSSPIGRWRMQAARCASFACIASAGRWKTASHARRTAWGGKTCRCWIWRGDGRWWRWPGWRRACSTNWALPWNGLRYTC